jgi:hypothetical protein
MTKSWMIGLILLWKNIFMPKSRGGITTNVLQTVSKIVGALASEVTVMNT